MNRLISARQTQIQSELTHIEILASSVDAIVIPDDYTETTSDVHLLLPCDLSPSASKNLDSPCSSCMDGGDVYSMKGFTSHAVSPSVFKFSILVWGRFELVFNHAVQGKSVVKQFSFMLESLSSIFDSVSKSLEKLSKPAVLKSPFNKPSSIRLSVVDRPSDITQSEATFLEKLGSHCGEIGQSCSSVSKRFQQLFTEIRVLKRECKGSFTMIHKRKLKLETDLQAAFDTYSRGGTAAATSSDSVRRSQREMDVLSRQWEAAQVQHQLGNAHLLDQFQKVEEKRLSLLRQTLMNIHKVFSEFYSDMQNSIKMLTPWLAAVKDYLSVDHGQYFINDGNNKNICDKVNDGIECVSQALFYLDGLNAADELLFSKIKKSHWILQQQQNLPSLTSAFDAFDNFFSLWPAILETSVIIRRGLIAELRQQRDSLQSRLAMAVAKEQSERRSYDVIAGVFERTQHELLRTSQIVNQVKEKVARSEMEISQPELQTSNNRLMRFMRTPIEKQRVKLAEAEAEFETAKSSNEKAKLDNERAVAQFGDIVKSIRMFVEDIEMNRIKNFRDISMKCLEHIRDLNDQLTSPIKSLGVAASAIDIRGDMEAWVDATRASGFVDCPEVVRRNLDRGMEEGFSRSVEISHLNLDKILYVDGPNLDTSQEVSTSNEDAGVYIISSDPKQASNHFTPGTHAYKRSMSIEKSALDACSDVEDC